MEESNPLNQGEYLGTLPRVWHGPWCARRESNPHGPFRKRRLFPLSYEHESRSALREWLRAPSRTGDFRVMGPARRHFSMPAAKWSRRAESNRRDNGMGVASEPLDYFAA